MGTVAFVLLPMNVCGASRAVKEENGAPFLRDFVNGCPDCSLRNRRAGCNWNLSAHQLISVYIERTAAALMWT